MAIALLTVLLAWFIKKRVLKPGVCLRARKSGRLQAKSRRQRPGKTRFSVKALRIGKRAVAGYDYVIVAVHEGKLIFWKTLQPVIKCSLNLSYSPQQN